MFPFVIFTYRIWTYVSGPRVLSGNTYKKSTLLVANFIFIWKHIFFVPYEQSNTIRETCDIFCTRFYWPNRGQYPFIIIIDMKKNFFGSKFKFWVRLCVCVWWNKCVTIWVKNVKVTPSYPPQSHTKRLFSPN